MAGAARSNDTGNTITEINVIPLVDIILVVLGKKGELFLNNKPISIEGLAAESKSFHSANPETSALLVADKEVTLEMVTELVDAIKSGGVKKVAFSIQKKI